MTRSRIKRTPGGCVLRGPQVVVGDIDWSCREHGYTVYERDPERLGASNLSHADMVCLVSEPEFAELPHIAELLQPLLREDPETEAIKAAIREPFTAPFSLLHNDPLDPLFINPTERTTP